MTLRQFIVKHCCNCDPYHARCTVLDGWRGQTYPCPVLDPASDTPTRRFKPIIGEAGKPWPMEECGPNFCTHAEALFASHPAADRAARSEYYHAAPKGHRLYPRLSAALKADIQEPRTRRMCPTPGCANPVLPHRRMCEPCAKAARRESDRKQKSRQRRGAGCPTEDGNPPLGT